MVRLRTAEADRTELGSFATDGGTYGVTRHGLSV
jgi:hypothetical protein